MQSKRQVSQSKESTFFATSAKVTPLAPQKPAQPLDLTQLRHVGGGVRAPNQTW